jgi:hypothetical protein
MKNPQGWRPGLALGLIGGVVVQAAEPSGTAAPTVPTVADKWREVYRTEFGEVAGDEWSKTKLTKSPSGKHTFLGPFGCEAAMLSLKNLPEHARVRISFDLMIILTWDGDANLDHPTPTAPDLFDVTVDRGPRLVHASFTARPSSSNPTTQSFPGRFPYDHLPPGTGAVESRTLGYSWNGGIGDGPDDYVYHVVRSFGHREKSLNIAFSGINLEPDQNEVWGLENVRVEILSAAPAAPLDAATFRGQWMDLVSADPKVFVPAMDRLVDEGDAAVAAIRRRVAGPAIQTGQEDRIRRLIAQLDDDAYAVREQASAGLLELGTFAERALMEARAKATSPEVMARIDGVLARLTAAQGDSDRRLCRLAEVLERIGTEGARAGLSEIGMHGGTMGAWEAAAALRRLEGKAEIPTTLDLPPGLPTSTPPAPVPAVRLEPPLPHAVISD